MAFKEEFSIVILIAASVCISSQKCPPQEDLHGHGSCFEHGDGSLEFYFVGYQDGRTIEADTNILKGFNFTASTKLILRFLTYSQEENRLSSNIFEGLNIRYLDFQNNNVSRWASEEGGPAFLGLEDTLEKVSFLDSIKEYPQNYKALMSLGHLRKLREVHFLFNYIFLFGDDWFGESANSLEVLKVEDCGMYYLGDHSFASLDNLRKISISSNKVRRVARSMFPNSAEFLEELDFTNNEIQSLPDNMFTNMPALTVVHLHSNHITDLPQNVWQPVWSSLEELDLSFNRLNCDDLEWILKVKPPKLLSGECHVSLKDFIERNNQNETGETT